MAFAVQCGCGRRVGVSVGTDVTCGCGRAVLVPTLRELRTAAPETDRRPADRPEVDRSHLQVIGFVLVVVAQVLGGLAVPLAVGGGGTDADRATTLVGLVLGTVLVQAAGVVVWARGKGQPFWFGLLLTPLGFVAIIMLLVTPTRHA